MFFAGRFTLSQSSPPARNATYFRTFYFRIYSRDFVIRHVFLLLDLHWDSPKLPCGMQRICRPFVFQTIISAFQEEGFLGGAQSRRLRKPGLGRSYLRIFFQETLCPVTLAHEIFVFYSSLYFCTSNTFSPILARFSHILVYTNFFFLCILHAKYFSYPWWRCC